MCRLYNTKLIMIVLYQRETEISLLERGKRKILPKFVRNQLIRCYDLSIKIFMYVALFRQVQNYVGLVCQSVKRLNISNACRNTCLSNKLSYDIVLLEIKSFPNSKTWLNSTILVTYKSALRQPLLLELNSSGVNKNKDIKTVRGSRWRCMDFHPAR